MDQIVKQVFQYIQLLRGEILGIRRHLLTSQSSGVVAESGPQRWFFDEIAFLGAQQFESKDAERAQNLVSLSKMLCV